MISERNRLNLGETCQIIEKVSELLTALRMMEA
jgi:hypothetical protein